MNNEEMMREGMAAIKERDYKQALEIAKKLSKVGYSGAFELKGLAQAGQDNLPGAIETLRKGVSVAPQVWLLWNLLGNYLSDEGHYVEACQAFERALSCPKMDESCVRYNWSIALARAKQPEEALQQIEKVTSHEHLGRAQEQRLALLGDLGRHEEAISLGQKLVSAPEDETVNAALVHAHIGRCYWRWKQDRAVGLNHVFKAIEISSENEFALQVLREIEDRRSSEATHFSGLVEFDFDSFGSPGTAVRSFHAVADDEKELLDDLKRLEPSERQASVRLLELKRTGASPEQLKGVYWRSVIVTSPERKMR